jgi:hypothetical protein
VYASGRALFSETRMLSSPASASRATASGRSRCVEAAFARGARADLADRALDQLRLQERLAFAALPEADHRAGRALEVRHRELEDLLHARRELEPLLRRRHGVGGLLGDARDAGRVARARDRDRGLEAREERFCAFRRPHRRAARPGARPAGCSAGVRRHARLDLVLRNDSGSCFGSSSIRRAGTQKRSRCQHTAV